MKANEKTAGFPIDAVDKAINTWKSCIRCAENKIDHHAVSYDFNEEFNFCGKNSALFKCSNRKNVYKKTVFLGTKRKYVFYVFCTLKRYVLI
jgi:hypothetical protein